MDMGEVFSSSWRVFWKYKLLWLFGLVPLFIYLIPAVVMGFVLFNPRSLNGSSNPFLSTGILIFDFVYFLIGILYMFVYVLADASIVQGTLFFDQRREKLSTGELIKQSLPFYWRAFGIYAIFIGAYILGIVVIAAIAVVAAIATMGFGAFCLFPLFLLMVPVVLLGVSLLELSRTSIIYENIGIGECLKRGWALFKEKFWRIVLMALVLYVGMFLVLFILYIPLYGFFFIPSFMNMARSNLSNPDDIMQFFSSIRWMYAIFVPIFSLVNGILNTFIHEVWAVTYVRLSRQPAATILPSAAPLAPVSGVQ